jgi:hypothetical protein
MSEHLEYRHFDVLQPGPDPDARMLGSFIIGIPAMTFREFQNNYPLLRTRAGDSAEHLAGRETKNRPSSLG